MLSPSWQLLVIGSVLLGSLTMALSKILLDKASALQMLVYRYVVGAVLVTFLWWSSGLGWPRYWWLYYIFGLATGIMVTLHNLAIRISMSKTALVSPTPQVFAILLAAIVFKEWSLFNLSTIAGQKFLLAVLLMIGLFYCFWEKDSFEGKKWSLLSWINIFFTGTAIVVAKFFLKTAEPLQLQFMQYWGSLTVVLLGVWWRGHKLTLPSKTITALAILRGIVPSLSILLIYMALQKVTVTQTSLLRIPLFIVITSLIGLIGFKESSKMTLKKWAGVGLALVMTGLIVTING